MRFLFLSTGDMSVHSQLRGQLAAVRAAGHEVLLVTRDTGRLGHIRDAEGIEVEDIPFEREIAPFRDLRALIRVLRVMVRVRPDIVVYGTPKASLLGALASWVCRVPTRVSFLYGLRLETAAGAQRVLLVAIERLVARLSTRTFAVSPATGRALVALGVEPQSVRVVGAGSANGIDVDRYSAAQTAGAPSPIRARTVGFVGRITPDKGIDDLVAAMLLVRLQVPDARLVVVGPEDDLAGLQERTRSALRDDWVELVGEVEDTAPIYRDIDVLALPSRREGLPTVILEAAAAATPWGATDFIGARDLAETLPGTVVPIGDVPALARTLMDVLSDVRRDAVVLRERVERGRLAVRELFASEQVHRRLLAAYLDEARAATSR